MFICICEKSLLRIEKLAYRGNYFFNFGDRRVQNSTKEAGLSLEGLQVFGHGIGFYFYKGKGGVPLFLFGRLAKPWIFGITTPKSATPPSPTNLTPSWQQLREIS